MRIPQPIQLEKNLITFTQFIKDNCLSDAQFGQDFASLELADEIKTALESYEKNADPDAEINLSPPALDLLKKVVKIPSRPYHPVIGVHFLPFFRAVVNA